MGMKNLVLYTHTDYRDVWIPLIRSISKYLSGYTVTFLVNQKIEDLQYEQIIYDENNLYTERLRECISKLPFETFLFMHEDMFLYDYPKNDIIDRYFSHIGEGIIKSIKLIPVGINRKQSKIDNTLFLTEYSKFSIQPTIISKTHFLEILKDIKNLSIWEFESAIEFNENHYIASMGNERKIGMYHYESLIFPYIATAIVKGKWNISEYPILDSILNECGINKNKRGIA
jgi:hypothetical protein